MNNYYLEEGTPFSGRQLEKLKHFLRMADLDYDPLITYSVILVDSQGNILACGSRHHNVLKCLAVSPKSQGNGYLNTIMSRLLAHAHLEGYTHLFLFTKPEYTAIFEDLGFSSILQTEDIQFMENTPGGIQNYLKREAKASATLSETGSIGAIVMNANPFTLGHLYLVEEAKKRCDHLHIFVLSEESPPFSAADRLFLVQAGCAHLQGVSVHGGSDYLISHATFPDYFIKDKETALLANGQLDLLLFCQYFKDAFHISKRFVGEEPFCPVTRAYNQQMLEILPAHGIAIYVLPRKMADGIPISATRVRRYFASGKLSAIAPLVPPTTYAYLEKRLQKG